MLKKDKNRDFIIPEIEETEVKISEEVSSSFRRSRIVTPSAGSKASDKIVYPTNEDEIDVIKRYEPFRKKKLISEEELKKRYGTKYYEFLVNIDDEDEFVDDEKSASDLKQAIIEEKEDESISMESIEDNNEVDEIEIINDDIEIVEEEIVEEITEKPSIEIHKPRPIIQKRSRYRKPGYDLLDIRTIVKNEDTEWVDSQKEIINYTLEQFNVEGTVSAFTKGPTVTQFEISLAPGVMVNKVTKIADNLKMNLAAKSIRIEAPIPGKKSIGIEVPNRIQDSVNFGALVDDKEFKRDDSPLKVALGIDINGVNIYTDIAKMPHGLIAGATGSGKSVCINTVLISLLYKASPQELRLILIDPKLVELAAYNDIPHLATPVITDPKIATAALKWVVDEMEDRFRLFQTHRVRGIEQFNNKIKDNDEVEQMPYLVIVVDELSDLMMTASNEVEDLIMRITQKARAAGIHLLVATQRPSTDVIKGTIKSNIPTRLAFSVSSYVDSMTILDAAGAEKLLGKGDMLFLENGQPIKLRLQGAYISDEEIENVTNYIRANNRTDYLFNHEDLKAKEDEDLEDYFDELFIDVARYVVYNNNASINKIQKQFSIGFNRAQALILQMEKNKIVSVGTNGKAREVLMSIEEFEEEYNF